MEKNNKTAEDILNERLHTGRTVGFQRRAVIDAMEEYASLQSSDKDERIKELETRLDSIEFVLRNCRSYLEVYRSDWREGEQSLYAEICSCIRGADSPLNL